MKTMEASRESAVDEISMFISPQEWMLDNEGIMAPVRLEQLRYAWGCSDLDQDNADTLNLIASLSLNSYKAVYAVEALHDPIQGTVASRALLNIYRPYMDMNHPRWEQWLSGKEGVEIEQDWTDYRMAMGQGISHFITELLPLEVIPTAEFILPWMDMRTPSIFPIPSPAKTPEEMLRDSIRVVEHLSLKVLLRSLPSSRFLHVINQVESWDIEKVKLDFREKLSDDEDLALYLSLLARYSPQQLRQLQSFSAAILENDDLLKNSLLPHIASFTWDDLLALADLTEEYNLEWALAAHEWDN